MAKPLNQFGGYLKFFFIIQWVNFIFCGLTALIALLTMISVKTLIRTIEPMILFFYSIVITSLCFKIIKSIKKQTTETPRQIIKLLTWILSAAFIFTILEWSCNYFIPAPAESSSSTIIELTGSIIRVLIWYAIWTSYFKKSKRVAAYYGANA